MKKYRIRMFAWLLACAVTVTSVPATGTLVYASEDLFSDGGETEGGYVEEGSIFTDDSSENVVEEFSEKDVEIVSENAEDIVETEAIFTENISFYSEIDTGLTVKDKSIVKNIYKGDDVEFEIIASIDEKYGSITYQWYDLDDNPIEGETTSILKLYDVWYDGEYYCKVSDTYGNTKYVSCEVCVNEALDTGLTLEKTSISKTVLPGEKVDFKITASIENEYEAFYTYKWYERVDSSSNFEFVLMEGETTDTLQISNAQKNMMYECQVSDTYGNTVKASCYLYIKSGLKVQNTSITKKVSPGEEVVFEVNASVSTGSEVLTYEWYDRNDDNCVIKGETSSTLKISDAQQNIKYGCCVSDIYGNSEYVYCYLYIDSGLKVEESYITKDVVPGDDVEFEIKASVEAGCETLSYEWYKIDKGYTLLEETTSVLSISNVQKVGRYQCNVSDIYGNTETVICKINIDTGLKLEEYELEKHILCGEDVVLEAKASVNEGCGSITYQWYEGNGGDAGDPELLEGETESVLKLSKVVKGAEYHCVVSDKYGDMRHLYCYIYVDSGITLENAAVNVYVSPGETAVLEAKASVIDGLGPLTYQWRKPVYEDEDWYEYADIDGETSSTMEITNVQNNQRYACYISNKYGYGKSVIYNIYINSGLKVEETRIVEYVNAGENVTFEVTASANEGFNFYYQWYGYDADIEDIFIMKDETTKTLQRSNVQENAVYLCRINDEYESTKDVWCYVYINEEEQHTHTWRDWNVTQAATYITTGIQTRSCTGCDAKETAEIARVTIPMPTLVSAAATAEKTITFTWSAVSGIDGYYVYRKVVGGSWIRLADLSSDKVSYVDSSVTAGITYIYTVKAYCNNGSEKIYGGYDAAGKTVTAVAKAATPTLVSAKATAGNTITFKWKAVSGVDGYRVYRKKAGESYKTLANVSADVTSYADTTAKAGVSYTYTVRAYNNLSGSVLWSSYVAAGKTTTAKAGIPMLVSAAATAGNTVTFKWKAVSGINGYCVYRKTAGGSYKKLADVSSSKTSYVDKTAKAGVSYTYTVRAYNKVNGSKLLGYYTAAGKTVTAKAGIPTLVSAKATAGNTVTFKWKAVSGINGYCVYRKTAGGSYTKLADVSSSKTSYVDKTAKAGVSYTYTVRAYNKVNGSKVLGFYTAAGKTVTAKAKAPTISSVKALGSGKVKVTWSNVSSVNGYRIYRKTAGGSWKAITTVSSKTTSYTDTTAKVGVKYYYTVRAYNTVNGSKVLGFYNTTGKSVTAK